MKIKEILGKLANSFKKITRKAIPPTKKGKIIAGILLFIILILIFQLIKNNSNNEEPEIKANRTVSVARVFELTTESLPLPVLGSVESQNQAIIRAESQGEISYVRKQIGDQVFRGEAIAELKNASERAEVLRAQGVLDAAKANLAKATNSSSDTQVVLEQSIQSAFRTADDAIRGKVDQFILDAEERNPRILSYGGEYVDRAFVNSTRVEVGDRLNNWRNIVSDPNVSVEEKYQISKDNLEFLRVFMDRVSLVVNDYKATGDISQSTMDKYKSDASVARSNINSSLSSLTNSYNNYNSSFGSGNQSEDIVLAQASVTQAEAGLLSAQARLAKTIISSPITGSVNQISIKQGDVVSSFQEVAVVANNNKLEITAFINDDDQKTISVGAKVLIDNLYEGTVSLIAPAINTSTKKVEIIILPNDQELESKLTNGQSVSLKIERNILIDEQKITEMKIPLPAVRITSNGAFVGVVNSDKKVSLKPVTVGEVIGDKVSILDGVTLDDIVITDIRGLKEGQEVDLK